MTNAILKPITAMSTLLAPTISAPSAVLVIADTLEMASLVLILTNVLLVLTIAMKMLLVLTLMAHLLVLVTPAMASIVLMTTNAPMKPETATCINIAGSFTCACNTGYSGNGVTCNDDECATETDTCDANSICSNTDGSFDCTCISGYSGDGVTCTDDDQCTAGTNNCDDIATYTNTDGGFTCACNSGFSGNGVTCNDNDECADNTHTCDTNASCSKSLAPTLLAALNVVATFGGKAMVRPVPTLANAASQLFVTHSITSTSTLTVSTPKGPLNAAATREGVAMDSLAPMSMNAPTTATMTVMSMPTALMTMVPTHANVPGAGYTGDEVDSGTDCTDVDECQIENVRSTLEMLCHTNAACTNTYGFNTCACTDGTGGTNIDECADNTHDCDENASCTDTDDGFSCACHLGWEGNGNTCTDFDESGVFALSNSLHNCDIKADCVNIEGLLTCGCNAGWEGDGVTCTNQDECANSENNNCDDNAPCTVQVVLVL